MSRNGEPISTPNLAAAVLDVAARNGGVFRLDRGGATMGELAVVGFAVEAGTVTRTMSRLVEIGRAVRVEKGAYVVADAFGRVEPFAAAPALVDAGYLSLWAAADHYRLTTQDVAGMAVVTDRTKAEVPLIHDYVARFHTTNADRLFGFHEEPMGGTYGRIADVEKMLIDLVWFYGQPITPDAFQVMAIWRHAFHEHRANPYVLADYAARMNSQRLARRVGYLLDAYQQPGSDLLAGWKSGDRKPITVLPGLPSGGGTLDPRWGIVA